MTLVVDSITVGYGSTDVLRDVTIVVPAGRVAALLGPNGAGKTTCLKACCGLLVPRRGRVLINGADITQASPHARVALGVCHIPQGRAIFASLTVAENLRVLDTVDPDATARAVEAFPVLGQRLQQVAGSMSGGEQQMLALARAYVTDPAYVLLDEVSMGLAPKVVDEIFQFLGRLVGSGVTMLVVEQYASKALEIADLLYVMNKGVVTFAGEPAEVDADALAASYLGSDMTYGDISLTT